MLSFIDFLSSRVRNLILQGARSRMSDKEFLEREIARWKNSPQRIMQIKGHLYYDNEHDILKRKRTMIGERIHNKKRRFKAQQKALFRPKYIPLKHLLLYCFVLLRKIPQIHE